MGKKKDKRASKKAKKAALKDAKKIIKNIFDKANQGQPSGGVGLLIIPIGKPDDNVSGPFEGTVSLGLQDNLDMELKEKGYKGNPDELGSSFEKDIN